MLKLMDNSITFEDYRREWLEEIRVGNPSTTELGHRFARKLLTQWRDIDDTSDDLVYCDGSGDGGIDIAYLYRGEGSDADNGSSTEGHTWYLVQSKYGSAFQGKETLLIEGQKVIETLNGQPKRLSSLTKGLLERLTIFRQQASELDRIVLIFATEESLTAEQKQVLNDVRAIGRARLGAIFDVEPVSIETIYLRTLEETTTTLKSINVQIKAELASSGEELLVGSISLLNLYDFLKAYRLQTGDLDQLYEKNVRRFLGSRGKVNKAIQHTLQKEPERFGLYNNGITIVVADFQRLEDGTTELIEPYVVNGCQTTRTIWEVCHQRLEAGGTGKNSNLQNWRDKARQGVVITKIVKVGTSGENLLQEITRYTNSQNAIREKDFLALTSDFRTLSRQMAEQYKVFLEIQRGGWESRRALQKQNPNISQFTQAANAFDLLKVYGSGWLGEAGTAFGRNAAFLPGGTIFQQITNSQESDQLFGVDDLYAAYRLQIAADTYRFGRIAEKPSRRQTRFLFYMVVLELLKDVMIRADINITHKKLTQALIKLFNASSNVAIKALLDSAIALIDEYLTPEKEDSVFSEPNFQNDLNSYLKSEQLGKNAETSPRFHNLLKDYQRLMGRSAEGQLSPRDVITSVITS